MGSREKGSCAAVLSRTGKGELGQAFWRGRGGLVVGRAANTPAETRPFTVDFLLLLDLGFATHHDPPARFSPASPSSSSTFTEDVSRDSPPLVVVRLACSSPLFLLLGFLITHLSNRLLSNSPHIIHDLHPARLLLLFLTRLLPSPPLRRSLPVRIRRHDPRTPTRRVSSCVSKTRAYEYPSAKRGTIVRVLTRPLDGLGGPLTLFTHGGVREREEGGR
ncbi:hypothetical protein AAT19DRAFT_9874 [Rhodotorula toruloides]|uniref:Uncharacterized protein n=1 Tax=Rhodotorula toruloides TaxID=5286 RepID=A0A2T0A176_RHOTO|nr:hypothetical protein AAT19DRAFT_9874 [Rhodotorula toruloides]